MSALAQVWQVVPIGQILGVATLLSIAATLLAAVERAAHARSASKLGFRSSTWWQTSGQIVDHFFDIDEMLATPDGVRLAADWYANQIRTIGKSARVDKLAFLEKDSGPIGALGLKDLLVLDLRIPSVVIRMRRRVLANKVKQSSSPAGKLRRGDNVVLISDVATTGRGITKGIETLQAMDLHLHVSYALVWLYTGQGAQSLLKEKGTILMSARTCPTPDASCTTPHA